MSIQLYLGGENIHLPLTTCIVVSCNNPDVFLKRDGLQMQVSVIYTVNIIILASQMSNLHTKHLLCKYCFNNQSLIA